MSFRYDINGLRGWALLGVLLFHFFPNYFSGGFSGVDVFFVISGYFMVANIAGSVNRGTFTLPKFYYSRVLRIVPPLALLLIALLVFGWYFTTPLEYKDIGNFARYALQFQSNIQFNKVAGYFDSSAYEKWLLHTWFLSVQMQFFIFFAPVFWGLQTFGSKYKKQIFSAMILMGILACGITSQTNSSGAFYRLEYRYWELLIGSLLYFLPSIQNVRYSRLLEVVGFTTIFAGFAIFSGTIIWPSYWVIIPVLATCLIFLANRQNSIITKNSICQYLGKVSYSVYLWHWVIVVGIHYYGYGENNLVLLIGAVISIAVGAVAYYLVEAKIAKIKIPTFGIKQSYKYIFSPVVALTVVVITCGTMVKRSNGYDYRLTGIAKQAIVDMVHQGKNGCHMTPKVGVKLPWCTYDGRDQISHHRIDKPDIILIGDSHALSVANALAESTKNQNKRMMFTSASSYLAVKNAHFPIWSNRLNEKMVNDTDTIMQVIEEREGVPVVFIHVLSGYLASRGGYYPANEPELSIDRAYYNQMCEIAKKRQVILLEAIPDYEVNVVHYLMKQSLKMNNGDIKLNSSRKAYEEKFEFVNSLHARLADECGIMVLKPANYLCNEEECSAIVNNRTLYYDSHHLNEYGNTFLVPMFDKMWEDLNEKAKIRN